VKTKNLSNTQIKENLATTLRAMVADQNLEVEFDEICENNFFAWNHNLVAGAGGVALPEISDLNFEPPSPKLRAAADLAAAYLLAHDKKIYDEKKYEPQEQNFFNEFEKVRVIACLKNIYAGAVKNILNKLESDVFSGSTSLSLILLKEIFGSQILPKTLEFSLQLEQNLNKKVVAEIKKLPQLVQNQSAFGLGVARVLKLLQQEKDLPEKQQEEKSQQEKNKKLPDELENSGTENVETEVENNFSQGEEEADTQVPIEQKMADFQEDDSGGEVALKLDTASFEENKIEFKNTYKIFTSKFDEVIFPQKLIGKNELKILRDQLDLKMAKLGSVSKKMSLKLKKKLLAKKNSFVERDSSRGVLDRKKLVRLVIDPTVEDIWVREKSHEYQNTVLTILLDNSGSMRGNPIVMSALACEIIAEILEKFLVKTEIIGFTTADWKGGKAHKLWDSAGRVKNPGRLNDLRHIVYKHFNQSLKKSKTNLGLMLKEGILKENIDGEALLFARARLMQKSEKRKILMVISDGTPIDDSTASANDSEILTEHLRHVINKIEKRQDLEIVGIGIGHSIGDFYRNSIAIKNLEELGDTMIAKIAELL
jgi:cobaltochelatase CobT